MNSKHENSFVEDVEFLSKHVQTIVLGESGGPQIAVVPQFQGRTMTSTATGDTSYAWINYELIGSGKKVPQINLYGGEDRFWLAPEGGQYSIYFDPGAPMDFHAWRVPDIIDTQPFELVSQSENTVKLGRDARVINHSGTQFEIGFQRQVSLLSRTEAETKLGADLQETDWVCHESRNELTNRGEVEWKPETGLLAVWVLCMSKPSEKATAIVPFKKGDESKLGSIVNSDYFGELKQDRLKIDETKGLIYFLGDGKHRSKLGLTFSRVESILGSWDPSRNTLTVVQFNLPEQAPNGYTNNVWEIQEQPYEGDVINSYNDGPNESGGMLGPFFELETLSPALALAPSQGYEHIHRTFRIEGPRDRLSQITSELFSVDLDTIESQFSLPG